MKLIDSLKLLEKILFLKFSICIEFIEDLIDLKSIHISWSIANILFRTQFWPELKKKIDEPFFMKLKDIM